MGNSSKKKALIFGGTGFIGLHFARHLLEEAGFEQIILADIKPPEEHPAHRFITGELAARRIVYQHCDVRQEIAPQLESIGADFDLIANFAAIHREPGHLFPEYYLTNLPGAVNVCDYAESIDCKRLIFTSSISPYGPSETPKDERSTPTPETAYGGSKLAAEWIHRTWQGKDKEQRRLLIVRPGVVFGPGEGGNVSRLVRAISKGFFVYAGNRNTRKAGIYVKELCHACWWCLNKQATGVCVYNLSMDPGPSVEEYVTTVEATLGKKAFIPSIPPWVLLLTASVIGSVASLVGIKTGINYVRVRKLVRSNNILPNHLKSSGYVYNYTLATAMRDWQQMMPEEWGARPDVYEVRRAPL